MRHGSLRLRSIRNTSNAEPMSILRPFLPCLYRLAPRGHWLAQKRPIRRELRPGAAPEWVPIFVPDVTADDFVLSSVVIPDEGELYMDLKLTCDCRKPHPS